MDTAERIKFEMDMDSACGLLNRLLERASRHCVIVNFNIVDITTFSNKAQLLHVSYNAHTKIEKAKDGKDTNTSTD